MKGYRMKSDDKMVIDLDKVSSCYFCSSNNKWNFSFIIDGVKDDSIGRDNDKEELCKEDYQAMRCHLLGGEV